MTHVSLDTLDESVKRFVLGLTADPAGSILELNGQPVACVVPPPRAANGESEPNWTDAKNARRIELIKKKHDDGLEPAEYLELGALQDEMLPPEGSAAAAGSRASVAPGTARAGGRAEAAPMTMP